MYPKQKFHIFTLYALVNFREAKDVAYSHPAIQNSALEIPRHHIGSNPFYN